VFGAKPVARVSISEQIHSGNCIAIDQRPAGAKMARMDRSDSQRRLHPLRIVFSVSAQPFILEIPDLEHTPDTFLADA